jgi:hypothetical protein
MSYNPNQIWTLIQRQLPEYIRDDSNYEKFVQFLQAYYQFLQQEGTNNPVELISNTPQNRDIDSTIDLFVKQFTNEYLENFPIIYNPDEVDATAKSLHREQISRVVKGAADIYTEKSVEDAYRALFRILYNEEIQFFYPKTVILKPSDGKWQRNITLKVQVVTGELDNFDLTYGSASVKETAPLGDTGATATVESIVVTAQPGFNLYELFLTADSITSQTKNYLAKYGIANPSAPAPPPFAPGSIATITLGTQVVTATILPVITGYTLVGDTDVHTVGEDLTVTDGVTVFTDAKVSVKSVTTAGAIKALNVTESGFDFNTGNLLVAKDASSNVVANLIYGGLSNYPGFYKAVDGFLSDQDHLRGPKPSKIYASKHTPDEYYQEFSYVIKSGISVQTWGDIVKKILHPIGYVVFGDVLLEPETDSGASVLGMFMFNQDDVNTIDPGGGYLYHILLLYFNSLVESIVPSVPQAIIDAGGSFITPNIFSVQGNVSGPSNRSFTRFMFLYPPYQGGSVSYGGVVPDSDVAFATAVKVDAWPSEDLNNTTIKYMRNEVLKDYYPDVLDTKKISLCPEPFVTLVAYP